MHKARLLKLAELLEADAKNPEGIQFDLSGWGYTNEGRPKIGCGTKACAIGLACLSPELQAEGLSFIVDEDDDDMFVIDPMYGDGVSYGWRAVRDFFEITEHTAAQLFREDSYAIGAGADAELAVAARIREFVAE